MAAQGEWQLLGRDANPVVCHTDQGLATDCHGDLNSGRACVDAVLDEFLDRACWPLNNFTGSDPVDCAFIQLPDNGPIFAYFAVFI